MPWKLKNDRPIYLQLVEEMERRIVCGQYEPGSQIPPVRMLAEEAAVNPNTMQKALSELEGTGLVYSFRTSGRFITEDKTLIEKVKTNLARQEISRFYGTMSQLGYSPKQTLDLLQIAAKELEQA